MTELFRHPDFFLKIQSSPGLRYLKGMIMKLGGCGDTLVQRIYDHYNKTWMEKKWAGNGPKQNNLELDPFTSTATPKESIVEIIGFDTTVTIRVMFCKCVSYLLYDMYHNIKQGSRSCIPLAFIHLGILVLGKIVSWCMCPEMNHKMSLVYPIYMSHNWTIGCGGCWRLSWPNCMTHLESEGVFGPS